MTLKEAKIGSTVTVKKLTGEGAVKRRIMVRDFIASKPAWIRGFVSPTPCTNYACTLFPMAQMMRAI